MQTSSHIISPLSLAPSRGATKPPSRLPILPVGLRRAHCFPRLALRPGDTAALRRSVVVRAQNRMPEEPNHFVAERLQILSRYGKISPIDEGYLYYEATDMSAHFCVLAGLGLRIASRVVDSASLNLGAPNDISMDTVHMTLHVYVNVFLHASEDSYNRKVQTKTVMSFLGALKGIASVSHILLQAALEALSDIHPRESLSEHALNCDVKTIHLEYNREMGDLEDGFRKVSTIDACKLLMPTISKGVKVTESFVGLMVARRQRAIEKAHKKPVK